MKKIKLNKSEVLGSALTREQLKGIVGGSSSGSSSGSLPCDDKKEGDSCTFKRANGSVVNGTCQYTPFSYGKLVCWSRNL